MTVNTVSNLCAALAHAGHHGDAETSGARGLLHALTHADHLLVLAAAAAALVVAQRVYRVLRSRRRGASLAAVPVDTMR